MAIVVYTEDEECVSSAILPLLRKYFTPLGHKVCHFINGKEAVDFVTDQGESIILVITDLSLADMVGGLEVTRTAMKHGIKKVLVFSSEAESPTNALFVGRFAEKYDASFRLRNKPSKPMILCEDIKTLLAQ